jgi:transcriptional regulator with XRE-family HTH domain
MKINEKIKYYRTKNKYSQENMAYALGIDQSQYCRREIGDAKFTIDDVLKIAELFKIEISDMIESKTIFHNSNNQHGDNDGQYINSSEQLVKQYEKRLKEKDELIADLKNQILNLEKK